VRWLMRWLIYFFAPDSGIVAIGAYRVLAEPVSCPKTPLIFVSQLMGY